MTTVAGDDWEQKLRRGGYRITPQRQLVLEAIGRLQHGTPEEILADTPSGLYVTEMMGFGYNPVTGDFSRGAAGFWIEGGKIVHPVSEVTISLNLDQLLKRVDRVGTDLDLRTATASPTLRVSRMTIAGA